MADGAQSSISASDGRAQSNISFPAEVLYLIADYAFSTWTDHELWFRLGQTCRVFRDAVAEHVTKALQDRNTALHTRFEQHCKGRIIRDAASVTRIETLVTVPVYLQAVFHGVANAASDEDEEVDTSTDRTSEEGGSKLSTLSVSGQWDFRAADDSDDRHAVFEIVCTEQTEQDLLKHYASDTPNADTDPTLSFTTKVLSLDTAETGKIEFEDIQVHPHSVALTTKSDKNRSPGLVFAASLDWREIWVKKLGRERFCQKKQTEKQIAWQAKVKQKRAEVAAKQEARAAERRAAAAAAAAAEPEVNTAETVSKTAELTI